MAFERLMFLLFGLLVLSMTTVKCEEQDHDGEESEESEEPEKDGDVFVLTDDNFDENVLDKDTYLVEFYAPWCGHCKSLAPAYSAAATRLKEKGVFVGKVDATVEEALAKEYDVRGYPTLKFFKKGKAYDYEGPRDEDGIVSYMEDKASPDWAPPPEAVQTLTTENFDDTVNNADLILVEFYAPWCGHCKKLAPEYEKAAQVLQKNDPPIVLAKVDATVENTLATRYGVTGYPTLKMFRKGKVSDYKGDRTKKGIVDYMKKQSGDASQLKETAKAARDTISNYDISIVGYFENENVPLFKTYMETANNLRDNYRFFHTFAKDNDIEQNSIAIFLPSYLTSKYEPKWYTFNKADATEEDITAFIKKREVPLVGELSRKTFNKRYGDKRPLVIAFYTVDFSHAYREATQLWRRKFAEIAHDYPDLTFAVADEDDQLQLFSDFGFLESGEEFNIGILGEKDAKYPMEPMEEYNAKTIRTFIDNFREGKLKPVVKSQPIPKKQGAVTVVVGNNFDSIVNQDKDVLLEFYAPWCGHCKKLEPVYKKLAKNLKHNNDLVIAKIDATANDYPELYKVEGFPTLFFIKKDDKQNPIQNEGGVGYDELVKFIQDNASGPISTSRDEL